MAKYVRSEYYGRMPREFDDDILGKIASFLTEIGILIKPGVVDNETFLPGIDVEKGALVVDEKKLLYPGDLLHEAGHIAVTPASLRHRLSGKVEASHSNPDTVEAAAISWSYAACAHLGLDPTFVFHEHGYHGRAEGLLLGFRLGVFPGLHELISAGMTSSEVDAERTGKRPFPSMQKWLRD